MFTFEHKETKKPTLSYKNIYQSMSLNSIKFESADIVLLYKNSLVDIEEKKHLTSSKERQTDGDPLNAEWKFLGENKKKTLVVVLYPDDVHLPDKQLSFLMKLLAACSLTIADVAILNRHGHQPSQFNRILTYFQPKAVLLFNTNPADFGLPMNFPDFQVQAYKDVLFVSSPSLETIEPDKNLKGKLWSCLKKIYSL